MLTNFTSWMLPQNSFDAENMLNGVRRDSIRTAPLTLRKFLVVAASRSMTVVTGPKRNQHISYCYKYRRCSPKNSKILRKWACARDGEHGSESWNWSRTREMLDYQVWQRKGRRLYRWNLTKIRSSKCDENVKPLGELLLCCEEKCVLFW